ncbi:MAG: type II secretion system F family protein [Candidatus Nanoarchaeia archaeon]
MKFKIPFTLSGIEVLKKRSKRFLKLTRLKKSKLDDYLKNAGENIGRRQYLSICYRNFILNLLFFSVIFTSVLGILRANLFSLYGPGVSFLISGFILLNQVNYPRIFSLNKKRDIEKNLIPVLQDMLVQLNSGVPIFRILVNISESNYGEVSEEFKKITKEINSGTPQIEAIEKYGKINTSDFFKRMLWQISNGMRAGSDMNIVIKEEIKSLTDEQAIQIQNYGSKLNPLVMFYMLITVILPSLGITFLIIISSILNISEGITKLIFFLIFGFVIFTQIMFLGLIKSRRPSLL